MTSIIFTQGNSIRVEDITVPIVEAFPVPNQGSHPFQQQQGMISSAPIARRNSAVERSAREYLAEFGWTLGLQNLFLQNLAKVAIRYFICDDSGSMMTNDGHRLIPGKPPKYVT
jgi:hypothetical protein